MNRDVVVNLFKKVARILEDDKEYEWLADEVKDYLNEIYVNEESEQDTFGSYLLVGRREAIAELILAMRFSNENDLAQAVLDYIEGLTRANREVGNVD
jgi:hypothetical protein